MIKLPGMLITPEMRSSFFNVGKLWNIEFGIKYFSSNDI